MEILRERYLNVLISKLQLFQVTFSARRELFQWTLQFPVVSHFSLPHNHASKLSFGTRYMVPILCTRNGSPSL